MIMKRIKVRFSKKFRENHKMIYYKLVLIKILKILRKLS